MRTLTLALTLSLLVVPVVADAQSSTAIPEVPFTRYQLANGLDVVLAPDSTAEEISVEWWVRAGIRDEPAGKFGLAHFFEHATPYGYGVARIASTRAVMDSLRTNSNAVTRPDYTMYYRQILPEGLGLFLREAADRIAADPAVEFTDEMVDRHRANVQAEIDRNAGRTWSNAVGVALGAGTFGASHPYGHDGYGTDLETARITPDDMIRWFRSHIRPEHITVVLVGAVDTAIARRDIARFFGTIPGGTRPPMEPPLPALETAARDTVRIPADHHTLILSWPVAEWGSASHPALAQAARVLTARLEASMPAGVTGAAASLEAWHLAGRFGVEVSFASTVAFTDVEQWVRGAVERLRSEPVTSAEINAARAQLRSDLTEQFASLGFLGSRSELLGQSVIFADDPGAWREVATRSNRATAAEVQAVVRQWLAGEGFVLDVRGMGAES